MIEWKRIDSAPTDGTAVLVFPPTSRGNGQTCSPARYDADRYATRPRPYWHRMDACGVMASRNNPPTHWAQMPSPPESQ